MADMNFMDVDLFFNGGVDMLSNFEKDTTQRREADDYRCLISDDFIDSILEPVEKINPLDDFLRKNTVPPNSVNLDCASDSGLSFGQDCSPDRPIGLGVDLCLNDALIETNSIIQDVEDGKLSKDKVNPVTDDSCRLLSFDSMEYVKEEEVECEEFIEPVYLTDTDSPDIGHASIIIQDMNTSDDNSNDVSDVHFSSANSLSDSKEGPPKFVKCRSTRINRWKSSNYSNLDRLQKKRKVEKLEENTSDDSDVIYPRLILTPEEQKLAKKEGIKLPSHYPLTKTEERDLKRIRRKIRNKVSAQDSRRRKKEYVDNLEERVKRSEEENADLMKRIKTLETQKMTLVAEVKKLQASLARCSGNTAPSSTCLLVFVMSLALILAPNLRNSTISSDNTDEGISLSEESQSAPSSPGRSSRNLLFAQKNHEEQTNFSEEAQVLTETLEKMQVETLEKMQEPDLHVLASLMDVVKFNKTESLLKDHDYFRPRKRLASEMLEEESWPPSNMLTKMVSQLKNIASTFVIEKGESRAKEPVVIDLLSD